MRMTVVGERRVAMALARETPELNPIAKALWIIAREINYGGRRCMEKSISHGATFVLASPLRRSIQLSGNS
jgi:hypothetical protein